MKWIAAKVVLDSPDAGPAVDLVADIFYASGLKGVVVNDPQMDAPPDWADDAVMPPEELSVTGYFADTDQAADQCRRLESALSHLQTASGIATRVVYSRIDEQDWAEAWKAFFWPERITDTIVVKPSWREYAARSDDIILEIDPGMAFGTGTHPTTALCIRQLQSHLRPGDTFLDVGTGSGILMIAAAKLGAASVCGVDNDEVAVSVAKKNLLANGVQDYRLMTGNLVERVSGTFHVAAANILAEVILTLLTEAAAVLEPKGILICSGIIQEKKGAVLAGLEKTGLDVIEVLEKEGWVAIAARRAEDGRGRKRNEG
jgi:ribosomal protein L11 methyltransferase